MKDTPPHHMGCPALARYAVVLCPDSSDPVGLIDAINRIDHIGPDGRACFTPDDDFGYASRWRHPSESELIDYLEDRLQTSGFGPVPHPDIFGDVLAFHRKFGCRVGSTPAEPDPATVALRVRLIREEVEEMIAAIERGDLPEIADGGVDSVYVIAGTLVAYGIDMDAPWRAVQVANMAKEGGPTRADGKILKPSTWLAPDIDGILAAQRPLAELRPSS